MRPQDVPAIFLLKGTVVNKTELIGVMAEVGFPEGVVNLVGTAHTQPMTGPMIADRRLRKISFTGSIPVGKHLAALAAKGMKRTTMELGGHSPVVVFADADLEKAAATAPYGVFDNAGIDELLDRKSVV